MENLNSHNQIIFLPQGYFMHFSNIDFIPIFPQIFGFIALIVALQKKTRKWLEKVYSKAFWLNLLF